MIPVFQESFEPAAYTERVEPSIQGLLDHDGVHLLDRRNIHIQHTIADLTKIVKNTLGLDAQRPEQGSH